MIAPLEIVKGMELTPQACVICANNPADELTGEQQQAIFAPGVDYDWGNSLYICKSCGEKIADLLGRVPIEEHEELKEEFEDLKEEHDDLEVRYESNSELLARIRDGKAAIKEVKSRKAA